MATSLRRGRAARGQGRALPPSNSLDVELSTALQAEAINPDKLRSLSVESGQALADLASHRVDAVVGSVWELPWQARERSIAVKSFNPAGYRVEYYGDSLFTLLRLAKDDPAMVQRFREASIKGWDYALQHPDAVAARIFRTAGAGSSVRSGRLCPLPDRGCAQARPLSRPTRLFEPERWSRIQQSLIAIGRYRAQPISTPSVQSAGADRNRNDYDGDGRRWLSAPCLRCRIAVVVAQRRNAVPAGAAAGGDGKPPGGWQRRRDIPAEMHRKWIAVRHTH
jgi:hypothetical protein